MRPTKCSQRDLRANRVVFNELPQEAQVLLMSATLSPEILDITKRFMDNPKQILLKNDELTLEGIKQFYINVIKDQWKLIPM